MARTRTRKAEARDLLEDFLTQHTRESSMTCSTNAEENSYACLLFRSS